MLLYFANAEETTALAIQLSERIVALLPPHSKPTAERPRTPCCNLWLRMGTLLLELEAEEERIYYSCTLTSIPGIDTRFKRDAEAKRIIRSALTDKDIGELYYPMNFDTGNQTPLRAKLIGIAHTLTIG